MIVRSYTGRTVPEALHKVRTDLGEAALIIETRPWKEPGLLGRQRGFEVVAAVDALPQRAGSSPNQASALAAAPPAPQPTQPVAATSLEAELTSIRRQLARLAAGSGTPTGHLGEELASALEDAELPGEILAELDDACARAGTRLDEGRRAEFVRMLLARNLPGIAPMPWEQCRRLLMVGPTGVGKTTTIAKLAGELVIKRRRSVALVTIDTYRVGAQDQLRAYADLLEAPFEVASTPAELARVLSRFADVDHVLVDTSGRSPADEARVQELRGFCRAVPGMAVMLAVAANAGRAEFAAAVERFSILPLEHAVVTKVDECLAHGRLYGCLRRHRLPVRYLTNGQEVPADIAPAEAEALAAACLERVAQAAA